MKAVKKILALSLAVIMLFAFAACGESDKKSNKKDKDSSGASDKISSTILKNELKIGESVNVPGKAEFFVEFCQITKRVNPPKPDTVYSYYAADEGKVYIDICLSFKNLGTESVNVSKLFSTEIIYGGSYKYNAFTVSEQDSRGDLSSYRDLTPLSQEYVHILAHVPEEVEASDKDLEAVITYNGTDYTLDIRDALNGKTSEAPAEEETTAEPETTAAPVIEETTAAAAEEETPAAPAEEETTAPSSSSSSSVLTQQLKDKQVVTVDGKGEFFIDFAKISKEVKPPRISGVYTYYPAENGKVYVDLCISYKNLDTYEKEPDDIADITLVYAGSYNYTGFATAEEDNRSDFSTWVDFTPLSKEYLHLIVQVPEVVQTSSDSVELLFSIDGIDYSYKLR